MIFSPSGFSALFHDVIPSINAVAEVVQEVKGRAA